MIKLIVLSIVKKIKCAIRVCLYENSKFKASSFLWHLELVIINGLLQSLRSLPVDSTTHSTACAKNLFDCSFELLRHALVSHLPHHTEELLLGQVTAVLDVFGLFPVAERLLKLLDDEAGGIRFNVNFGSAILYCKAHGHSNSFPCLRALDNIVANLFRRHAQRTNLWRQYRRWSLYPTILT